MPGSFMSRTERIASTRLNGEPAVSMDGVLVPKSVADQRAAVALLERILRNPENVAHDTLLRADVLRFVAAHGSSANAGVTASAKTVDEKGNGDA